MKIRYLNILFILLILLCPFLGTQGKVWNVDDIPIPYFHQRTQHISDPDNYLTEDSKAIANSYLDSLETKLGIQSLFIIVSQVPDADCFRFAQDIGNKYGVGTKEDRNGLIIVLAVDDRRSFIAPGKGLEEHLTDVECHDIYEDCIVENMKVNKFDDAVIKTSQAVYWNLKGDSTHYKSIVYSSSDGSDDAAAGIIVALIIFGIPIYIIVRKILERFGLVKPLPKGKNRRRHKDDIDDFFPPFFFGGGGSSWGGGSSGGGFSGGSFGGGSFGGGGSGGGW